MSHIKNVEAFGKLTGICTGYGGTYNPGNPNLQAEALSALMNNARQVISEVRTTQIDYDNVTNTREVAFKEIQRLGARIMSALKSSGAGKLTIADAQASQRKLNGKRTVNELPAQPDQTAPVKPKTRRARGLDYPTLAFHFSKLVETVSAEPGYRPNETLLSVAGLTATKESMVRMNEAVNSATAKLNNARKNRNTVLYDSLHNLVDTANLVKQYVRSAYGPASEQSKELRRIRFAKPQS